ncbi:Asparagine-rich zinc finger protein AZF1 [Dufourea novaeangliae]|uniref:Asparagine-rich zinc finger protein AZF1 n=1 Tax=Dufourea novaeangliae TaxID=178035 RepID=A0A154PT97_DUFNO|nr:Asparagine-rich zinc finger protein AZF1 [Dufourea novaeangliae]
MAHATLPKLICKPTNTSNMCPTNITATTALSDVLNSEPVKRLLNQPNIIIKTIPLDTKSASVSKSVVARKTNKTKSGVKESKQSKLNTLPSEIDKEENKEDENLLPSKTKGKSEITLVPIKREKKSCGHYEPCEHIVCDVTVHQYVDREGASPMLAINIEEDEINAPVSKHCKNEQCDALSIDHDCCRRAMVRLYRCNQSKACDICGIELQTRRCRIYHRHCTRKNEYRHNKTDSTEILKIRMREREMQLTETSMMNKKYYIDPARAMETLKKNEELIIIPQSVPAPQPPVYVTTPSATEPASNVINIFGKLFSSIPIVLPQQSLVLDKTQNPNKNGITRPLQVTLPNTFNTSFIPTTNAVPLPQNQYFTFTTQNNSQPITLQDLLFTQPPVMNTPIQPNVTPIRVVPITNLITQPSLLHQTQGIPRYCIMADTSLSVPLTLANPQSIQHPQPIQRPTLVPKGDPPNDSKETLLRKKKQITRKKRRLKKKEFKCDYCHKSFSTDWYFKMHVAMHTGESRHSCEVCKEPYTNKYDLKKHMLLKHKGETIQNNYGKRKKQYTVHSFRCLDCPMQYTSMQDLKYHRQRIHGRVQCTLCHAEVPQDELIKHFVSIHRQTKRSANMKQAIVENGNVSDETYKANISSNIVKTETNNINSQNFEEIKIELNDEEYDIPM